jgi:hypothetical protein
MAGDSYSMSFPSISSHALPDRTGILALAVRPYSGSFIVFDIGN